MGSIIATFFSFRNSIFKSIIKWCVTSEITPVDLWYNLNRYKVQFNKVKNPKLALISKLMMYETKIMRYEIKVTRYELKLHRFGPDINQTTNMCLGMFDAHKIFKGDFQFSIKLSHRLAQYVFLTFNNNSLMPRTRS